VLPDRNNTLNVSRASSGAPLHALLGTVTFAGGHATLPDRNNTLNVSRASLGASAPKVFALQKRFSATP
jgi:hypothetical protein